MYWRRRILKNLVWVSAKPNYSLLLSEDAAWESVNEIRMAFFISPARWRSAHVRRNYILIDLFTDRVWDFIFLFSGSAEMSTICLCVRQHPACLGCIWIPHLWLHSSWKHQCGECVLFFFSSGSNSVHVNILDSSFWGCWGLFQGSWMIDKHDVLRNCGRRNIWV